MIAMIVGKIGLGAIFDRLGTLKGSILGGSVQLISAVLAFAHIPSIPWAYAVFYSASAAGGGTVSPNYLAGAYSAAGIPLIFSVVTMASSLASPSAIPFGWIFDVNGSI
jgi:hypothetical protein